MRRILFLSNFIFLFSFAHSQTRVITCIVTDAQLTYPISHAIAEIKDSCTNTIQKDSTNAAGIFHFTIYDNCGIYFLHIKHDPEGCIEGNLNQDKKIIASLTPDTIRISLAHMWNDFLLPSLKFKNNSFVFNDDYDSTNYCDLLFPDTSCLSFHSLNSFIWLQQCYQFSKIEIDSYYIKAEAQTCGDSLARERCQLVIDYLYKKGLPKIEFVIKTFPYELRPRKSSYGYFLPEFDLVTFRVLAY